MDFNKKKLNLNKKLIFYLAIVMISVIVIMSLSINLSVKNKILYYSQSISNLSSEELIKYRDLILKDMKNLIIGISLLMIIVVIAVSVFLSQKISKPIIVVSKMTDFIKMGGYDQKLEYESSIVEIDNLINSINELSRELYKMENMRKNLTSDISHELRTPLTSIQTHLEAMIDGIWEPSKERLNSVNEEVIRLSHLVNQLKNLAKFDLSIDDSGLGRIEKISYDAYNESTVLVEAVERFRVRTGHYPERLLADQIYRTRDSRKFCKLHGIRLSGPKLGRPSLTKQSVKEKRQEYFLLLFIFWS